MFLFARNLLSLHPKSSQRIKKMRKKLQQIASELDNINRDLRREERVMQAELKDRQAKNLQGSAAIEHFNSWMAASGINLTAK